MTREELYVKLYDKLLDADVLNILNFNSEKDLQQAVIEEIGEVFRDYLIVRGETLE